EDVLRLDARARHALDERSLLPACAVDWNLADDGRRDSRRLDRGALVLEAEIRVADANDVAIAKERLLDWLAVDEGAIAAPEVDEAMPLSSADEAAVLTRRGLVVEDDVGAGIAADHHRVEAASLRQRIFTPEVRAVDDRYLSHVVSERRTSPTLPETRIFSTLRRKGSPVERMHTKESTPRFHSSPGRRRVVE